MFDDDTGYELSDPKHPTYRERMVEMGDHRRKFEREHRLPPLVDRDTGDETDAA